MRVTPWQVKGGETRIAAAKSRDRGWPEEGIHRRKALRVVTARMSFTGSA